MHNQLFFLSEIDQKINSSWQSSIIHSSILADPARIVFQTVNNLFVPQEAVSYGILLRIVSIEQLFLLEQLYQLLMSCTKSSAVDRVICLLQAHELSENSVCMCTQR